MRPLIALCAALAATAVAGSAFADKKGDKKAEAPADEKPAGVPKSREVPRDPDGVKGVSPFWEAVSKGDSAYVARDFDGAITAYRDAITKSPQNALGHYRIGEAHLAKADSKEAEAAWVAALRYVGEDNTLRGKILFCLADLRERQKLLDDANESWTKYEEFAKSKPEAKTYPASAVDRKQRIAERKKMIVDYGAVKERIAKRLAEANEKAKKSAGDGNP